MMLNKRMEFEDPLDRFQTHPGFIDAESLGRVPGLSGLVELCGDSAQWGWSLPPPMTSASDVLSDLPPPTALSGMGFKRGPYHFAPGAGRSGWWQRCCPPSGCGQLGLWSSLSLNVSITVVSLCPPSLSALLCLPTGPVST